MSSRQYPDKLMFQSRTLTTAADGQVTEAFSTAFTRYGRVEQTSAVEVTRNDQQQSIESYRIRLPRDNTVAAIDAKWRVLWRNQFNVTLTLNLTRVDTGTAGRSIEIILSAIR